MQLELGQLIIDTMEDLNDVGIVVGIEQGYYGDPVYRIFWTCRRDYGVGNYTTEITYTERELELEYSQWFKVVEKRT